LTVDNGTSSKLEGTDEDEEEEEEEEEEDDEVGTGLDEDEEDDEVGTGLDEDEDEDMLLPMGRDAGEKVEDNGGDGLLGTGNWELMIEEKLLLLPSFIRE